MKNATLLYSLIFYYSGLLVGAAGPQEATLEEQTMRVLLPYLYYKK